MLRRGCGSSSKLTSTFSCSTRSSISADVVSARRSASSSGSEKKLRGHSLRALHDVDLGGEDRQLGAEVEPGEQAEHDGEDAVERLGALERVVDVVAAEVLEQLPEDRRRRSRPGAARASSRSAAVSSLKAVMNSSRLSAKATSTPPTTASAPWLAGADEAGGDRRDDRERAEDREHRRGRAGARSRKFGRCLKGTSQIRLNAFCVALVIPSPASSEPTMPDRQRRRRCLSASAV